MVYSKNIQVKSALSPQNMVIWKVIRTVISVNSAGKKTIKDETLATFSTELAADKYAGVERFNLR